MYLISRLEAKKISFVQDKPNNADRVYSYLERGNYTLQLNNLRQYFSDKQILILVNNALLTEHAACIKQVLRFLAMDEHFMPMAKTIFPGDYQKNNKTFLKFILRLYYRRANQQLSSLLNHMGYVTQWRWLK